MAENPPTLWFSVHRAHFLDLFHRLMAFFEDNILSVHGGLTHHGDPVTADEDLSPTLENTVVVLWLQLIHPGLPLLVK